MRQSFFGDVPKSLELELPVRRTAIVVRHADRTTKEGKGGSSLSEFGREMNPVWSSYLKHKYSKENRNITSIGVVGSTIKAKGEKYGRSAITALDFGKEFGVKNHDVEESEALAYNTYYPLDEVYDHVAVYDDAFDKSLVNYLGAIGFANPKEVLSAENRTNVIRETLIDRIKNGVLTEKTFPILRNLRGYKNDYVNLEDLDSDKVGKEVNALIARIYDRVSADAQLAARNVLISRLESQEPVKDIRMATEGYKGAMEYAGGLAYELLRYFNKEALPQQEDSIQFMGMHGPQFECLMHFVFPMGTPERENIFSIFGFMHTSESVEFDYEEDGAGRRKVFLKFTDPSKFDEYQLGKIPSRIEIPRERLKELSDFYLSAAALKAKPE